MVDDIAVQEFVDALSSPPQNTITTYNGVVSRIDNEGVVWVRLAGSNNETPTASTSAEVESGDDVTVEWRNNKLYIGGNYSNPSAGSIRVDAVQQAAQVANQAAANAVADAGVARSAAQQAQATAEAVEGIAIRAEQSATDAQSSADSARSSANTALDQLGIIENVVGVLDLLSKHGTYSEITDTEAVAENGKWYFTRSGAGTATNPYTYAVANLNVGDSVTGYYELTDIDEAITNYVSSHLALTDDGLSLQQDGSDYRLLISTDGLKIIGANGATVASYGTETTIGNATGFNVKITGTELGFYQGAQRVAYINNNQLYITQSVVLQQMDLGIPVANGGLGQWSWKVHPNAQSPSRNNLNLKWIG